MIDLVVSVLTSLVVLHLLPKFRGGFHSNMSKEYLVIHLCFVSAGAAFLIAVMLTLMFFLIGEAEGEIVFVNKDDDEYDNTMTIPITIIIYYLFSTASKIWDLLFPRRQTDDN